MSHRAGLFVLVALLLAGCARKDPYYCPGRNHNDNCAEPPEPTPCTSNDQCAEPTGVCDVTGSMTCVQCTPDQPGACTGATPACGEDRTCRACQAHPECPASDACLPDGSCVDPAQIAYVKPPSLGGTDNPSCTLAMPCTKVASALATGRPYVKLAGTNDEGGTVSIDSRNVILLAERDAKLVRTSNGLHVEVKGTSQVEIYDLEISGATGAQGFGISMPTGNTATLTLRRVKVSDNAGGGIVANGGTLTISQSTISGNQGRGISSDAGTLTISQSTISENQGGGISMMNGTFGIVGNVFFANGTQTGTLGGISISTTQNVPNRLEFNSFNSNQTQLGIGSAIHCIAGSFTARNNIMSGNGTLTNMEQVGGTCAHTYSIVRPGMLPSGVGNSSADPLFVNTTTGDLHLSPGSPALGAADPNSDLTGPAERDIDGGVRTSPADIGADEVP